jgi:hypothetical protein
MGKNYPDANLWILGNSDLPYIRIIRGPILLLSNIHDSKYQVTTIGSILVLVLASYFASALSSTSPSPDGGYSLPIKRKTRSQHGYRPQVGAIGLGDMADV